MVSKLPVRQCTYRPADVALRRFSKLPVRQCTMFPNSSAVEVFSKLPVRQCTESKHRYRIVVKENNQF